MALAPISATNLPSAAWADEFLANTTVGGVNKVVRVPVANVMNQIAGGVEGGLLTYLTQAELFADLTPGNKVTAEVVADADPAKNGRYRKAGATGAGGWERTGDIRHSFVALTVTGGTGNAILASAPVTMPVGPDRCVFVLKPTAASTGAVTIAVNGGAPVEITDSHGEPFAAGYFAIGGVYFLLWNGAGFRAATDLNAQYWAGLAAASASAADASADAAAAFNPAFLTPAVSARGGLKSLLGRGIFLGDDAMIVTGQEYLAAWYKALVDKRTAVLGGTVANLYAFLLGDSKVAGTGTTAGGTLDALLDFSSGHRGFTAVDFGRYGYGGEDSVDMDTTRLATLMANPAFATTSLVILNFGSNEKVTPARTLAETDAATRSICAKLWDTGAGGRSKDDLSILIMGQTAANNETAGYLQNDDLMRELNTLYRDVAADVGACFFDAYSLFRQAHAIAGWMDVNIGLGNSNVHPGNNFNAALTTQLTDIIFPQNLEALGGMGRFNYANSGIYYPATATLTAASLPSAFELGASIRRVSTAGAAWPADGIVETVRNPGGVTRQTLYSRTASAVMTRTSNADAWNAWSTQTSEQVTIALQGSWLIWAAGYDLKAKIVGDHVHLSGLVKPGVTTSGTTIGTLPAGFRPPVIRYADCRQAAALGNRHPVSIAVDGSIKIDAAFAGTYLSFDGVYFSL